MNSKVNCNHEIRTQTWRRKFFPQLDLNHGTESQCATNELSLAIHFSICVSPRQFFSFLLIFPLSFFLVFHNFLKQYFSLWSIPILQVPCLHLLWHDIAFSSDNVPWFLSRKVILLFCNGIIITSVLETILQISE